jgi:hypothetical protein
LVEEPQRTHFPATIVTSAATPRTRRNALLLAGLLLVVSLGVFSTVVDKPGPTLPAFLPVQRTDRDGSVAGVPGRVQ